MALKPPPMPPNWTELALQSATTAIQAGRPADAERLAAEVLASNAGSLPAMKLLGTALLMQGRGREALVPLERAARQSHDAATETWLAMALRQLGREGDARERLERAVKRRPPFPPAFLELANLLSALGRPEEAIEILQQGLAATPNVDLLLQLGRLYEARGKNPDARHAFARAVALAPGNPAPLFALARACQAERDFAQAAEIYRIILASTSQDADAQTGLGICLVELGRGQEALNHLRAASRSSAKVFGEIVRALADAGRGRFWLRPSDAARTLRDG